MSRLARTLMLAAALAAMNLAGMTAVAQAYPLDPTTDQRVTTQQQPTDAIERFRRGERASQEQPTTDAALRRVLAQEHSYSFRGYSDTPAPAPDGPSGQPDWLVLGLGVLAAALALSTGLAVLAARRAGRKMRAGQAA
jgi:hypothetical protein